MIKNIVFVLLISIFFVSCATWNGVKEDSKDAWDSTKEGSKEVWHGTKEVSKDAYEGVKKSIHNATAE